ncbi:MAG: tetratricopeptide repeat protein [Candidatus Doudnabacteria bacterium]|nr:tetratricopeptide repeat protein [Candidatus Doudnabacteria bacterium]
MPKKYLIAILIIVGFLLFANTFNNQMFWDDDDIILKNQFVHNFELTKFFTENQIAGSGLVSNYWRPFMLSVFSIEWQIWKDWPPGYHFVNTSLHIANAILLFFILRKLLASVEIASSLRSSQMRNNASASEAKQSISKLLAFLTSLVFLIHPLQTEAVAYVSGLADPLSTFFILLGILFYLKFRGTYFSHGYFRYRYYWLTIGCYIAAVLSKDTAVIMPAMLAITDYFYLKEQSIKARVWKVLKSIWPFFALAGLYLILRATTLNFNNTFNVYGEENAFTESFGIRLLTFFRAMILYMQLLFWPRSLHMERTFDIPHSLLIPDVLFGGFAAIALLAAAFATVKKYPIVSFGILWFFARLFPNSNLLFPNSGLIYEHWMYVPMIGIFLVVIWLLLELTQKFNDKIKNSTLAQYDYIKISVAIFMLYLIPLSAKTIFRNNDWDNPIRFYNQTLRYAPGSYRAINNLGMAYADGKQHDKAIEAYERAIAVDPNNAVAHHNLGNSYKELGKLDLAVEHFEKAISKDSDFLFSYNALLSFYLSQKDYQSAIEVLERLKHKNPNDQTLDKLIEQFKSLRR